VNLYTPLLRDAGAKRADASVRIQNRDRLNQPATPRGGTGKRFVCRVNGPFRAVLEPQNSPLIDIVSERKRNADGVCPCGFRVTGDEETNVDSVF
jgi:hypothetical protein